jgi:5-methylcytosine-specific restriction enzyme A
MNRLPQRCREAGCGGRTTARNGRCEAHQSSADRRPSLPGRERWSGWYSLAIWQKVKAAFRARYPDRAIMCQHRDANGVQCHRPATDIDHVVPHRGDWQLFLGGVDYDNLQGLCKAHHSAKTVREDGGFGQ